MKSVGRVQIPQEAFMAILMRELGRVDSPYLPELDREFMADKFAHLAACIRVLRPGLSEDEVPGVRGRRISIESTSKGLFR